MLQIGALLSEQENFGDDDKDVASEIEDYDDDDDDDDTDDDDEEEEETEEWVIRKDGSVKSKVLSSRKKFFHEVAFN